jgi:ATP-dependent RNA helicase DeaD
VLQAIQALGYEAPTPIQAQCIPHLLEGRDLLGQAQTGTGKTAAFALPLLCRIDPTQAGPQVLVLTPTRELALQVAEAFQSYARHLPDFHVLPIYGGQSYSLQIRQLRRGAHVVVGTPGRVMDHLRRGTLSLAATRALVLDEADEMLNMGFIEDIEWIFDQAPQPRQVALFSATLPETIRRVAQRHLVEPVEIRVAVHPETVHTTAQQHCVVTRHHKLDVLTRVLELEDFDAMLVFVRTKNATEELAEKLVAHGFAAEALNGDMSQAMRERAVERLKGGRLDILVATDVAARGLDVERITHVVNYDIPNDPESYVHRIGRTGRAGRHGHALLLVEPRERYLLQAIERTIRQRIPPLEPPSADRLSEHRIDRFTRLLRDTLAEQDLDFFYRLATRISQEQELDLLDIAAALSFLMQRERPLEVTESIPPARDTWSSQDRRGRDGYRPRGDRPSRTARPVQRGQPAGEQLFDGTQRDRGERLPRQERPALGTQLPRAEGGAAREGQRGRDDRSGPPGIHRERKARNSDIPMSRYRIEVGRRDGVTPREIVGAIANEAGLEGRYIGRITIQDDHSTLDLPDGMPREIQQHLRRVIVCGKRLELRSAAALEGGGGDRPARERKRTRQRFSEGD